MSSPCPAGEPFPWNADEFLATLSHELRNPIHAIQTNAWLIKSRSKDAEVLRPTEAIDRQIQRLNGLLEDLLDVVRLAQRARLEREPLAIQQVVVAAVEATQESIGTHRRELAVDLPPEPIFVEADSQRLGQALGNIVENAVKYTPQQGAIRVSVREEAGFAVVRVLDQGVGIPAKDLPHVFDLFTRRPEGRRHSEGGLGIGLHIARQVVESHGGSLEARSEGPGKGSEFVARIPLTSQRPHADPAAGVEPEATSLDILVVDDNRDAADSLASVLEVQGHRVRMAYDGDEALALATSRRPQLALVDIGMPGMDGYELAGRLGSGTGPRPVLVAVTGWGAPADKDRAKAAGFDYHLTKPLDYDALGALVATITRRLSAH